METEIEKEQKFWIEANKRYYDEVGQHRLWFLGVLLQKCPLDLWIYQELIYRTRPDLIIETGTFHGGSALYLATMCELMKMGHVMTIDINEPPHKISHNRLKFITGSSIDPLVVDQVQDKIKPGDKVMVILDSDHSKDHVLKELELYSGFVTYGNYLIVEDTNVNGHPVRPNHGPGPMEALEEWFRKQHKFAIDKRCEKFGITMNPNGYLRRMS